MPYKTLKITYPILKKYKYLTPVYQVVRWGKMLSSGKFKNILLNPISAKHINQEQLDSAEKLLDTLKLKIIDQTNCLVYKSYYFNQNMISYKALKQGDKKLNI